jgi:ribosomal-protein-alanine N-acetyltransferase
MNGTYDRALITTERLLLRPYTLDDAPELQRLIGEWDVAKTLMSVPHPYPDGAAEEFINRQHERAEKGEFQFAITHRKDGYLIGGIGFHQVDREAERAEIGYWIAKPYWNNGYGTEAARAVVKFGFEVMKLNRIHAAHFSNNPASGRIMQKIGMKYEGCRRQHVRKWGELLDWECYGILRNEYLAAKNKMD